MRARARRARMVFALVAVVGGSATAQDVVVVRGATVIDGTGAPPLADAVILVRGDRIEAVGPRGTIAIPAGATVRDLPGRFVLPGFIDMHAHVAMGPVSIDTVGGPKLTMRYDDAASRELTTTLLAFGITTIRNPAGPTIESVALRDDVRLGRLRGPRIFTAGSLIDAAEAPGLGVGVTTADEARAAVVKQVAAGVDYVKVYAGLRPELVTAAVDEAHRHGVRAIGHLFGTSWTDAARAGIDGIVHIVPGSPSLLPASRRAAFVGGIHGTEFMLSWFEYLDLAAPEIEAMLQALTAGHVSVDPTLTVFEAMARGNSPAITHHPDLRYTPLTFLENWQGGFTLSSGWSEDDYRMAARAWPKVLAFTRRLHQAGVLLTVGTDVPNPWVPPGASFHRELELLVGAGITPADVLVMATRNGAQALGLRSEIGTVTAGKLADLVVLQRDPLADIRHTRSIEWIVQAGRWNRPAAFLPARLSR